MTDRATEPLPAQPNLPPGETWLGRARYALRVTLDMQVSSVLTHLEPWLAARSGSILEVGCGAQPYRHLVPPACAYRGLEWTGSARHFAYQPADTSYYGGGRFPFDDAAFDALFSTEVLEHVYETSDFLAECYRVLKPDGRLLLTVPFQARYHYKPMDFWRFTPASLERLLQDARFQDISIHPRGNDIAVAAYKVTSVVIRWLNGSVAAKLLGLIALLPAGVALAIGHLSLRVPVGSTDDCLGYVALARRAPSAHAT